VNGRDAEFGKWLDRMIGNLLTHNIAHDGRKSLSQRGLAAKLAKRWLGGGVLERIRQRNLGHYFVVRAETTIGELKMQYPPPILVVVFTVVIKAPK
jgi:hypothetical protein